MTITTCSVTEGGGELGVISTKLGKVLSGGGGRRTVSLADFAELRAYCEESLSSAGLPKRLRTADPIHAFFIVGQNMASIFAEVISAAPEMKEYYKAVADAEGLYFPDGPPISPLTRSYFTCWAFFDLAFGKDRETIGTCFIDLAHLLKTPPPLLESVRLLQASRMGIYEHGGTSRRKYLDLTELLTGRSFRCICPAGYIGRRGELWYARVLPPPVNSVDYSVVMTTPYILVGHSKKEWIDFFGRQGLVDSDPQLEPKLGRFMKHGLSRHFWNEFVFEAYFNHRREFILLEGIPDKPETLPHSSVNA